MQWGVVGFPVQSTQLPEPPQASSAVPGWQVELVPQHPAPHAEVAEQASRHRPVAVSQPAAPEGQSETLPQPH